MQKGQQHSRVAPAHGYAHPWVQSRLPGGRAAAPAIPTCSHQLRAELAAGLLPESRCTRWDGGHSSGSGPQSRWLGSVSFASAEPRLQPCSSSHPDPSPPSAPGGCFSTLLPALLFIAPHESRRRLCHISRSLLSTPRACLTLIYFKTFWVICFQLVGETAVLGQGKGCRRCRGSSRPAETWRSALTSLGWGGDPLRTAG